MATLCHVAENSRGDRLLRERRACAQRYAHRCRGLAPYRHRQQRHMRADSAGGMAHMTVMAITDPPVLKATDCTCSRPAVSELLVSSSGVWCPGRCGNPTPCPTTIATIAHRLCHILVACCHAVLVAQESQPVTAGSSTRRLPAGSAVPSPRVRAASGACRAEGSA